jgi:hypothetical protein
MARWLVRVAVVGMVGMWVYVLYLAIGPGRQDPPDKLDDPAFALAAQEHCSAALDLVAELPPAAETATAAERAQVLAVANGHLEDMLEDLATIVPEGDDGEIVREWLADWTTYLGDREEYAEALETDPEARLLVTPKEGDQITEYLDSFARDNDMPACSTPADA